MTYRTYGALEKMSPQERQKYQDEKVSWVVRYAYENTRGWRKKLDKAGVRPSDIRSVKDLEKIPVTTKGEVIQLQKADPPFGGLAVAEKGGARIYMSPGPIYVPENALDIEAYAWANVMHGIKAGDVVLVTYSYHMVPAGYPTSEALKLIGATTIPSGPGNGEQQLQIMRDNKVTVLIGFTSFIETLIEKAGELGYDFRRDFAIRIAVCAAEVMTPERRKKIESYGIDARTGYGTAQFTALANECEKKDGFHTLDSFLIEIVDPATGKCLPPGEIGEIVVTSFNEALPWIRLGTGDLSFYVDEPCSCGRTSYRLARIVGRVGEARKVRGLFVTPEQVELITSRFVEISRLQVALSRVGRRDEIAIKMELLEGADRERLSTAVAEKFQEICTLKVDRVEVLPQGTILGKEKIVDGRVFR